MHTPSSMVEMLQWYVLWLEAAQKTSSKDAERTWITCDQQQEKLNFNSNLPHSPIDAASGRYFESPNTSWKHVLIISNHSDPRSSCTLAMFVTFHSLGSKAILCHGLPVVPSLRRSHVFCRPDAAKTKIRNSHWFCWKKTPSWTKHTLLARTLAG